jgi:hypothetical protein
MFSFDCRVGSPKEKSSSAKSFPLGCVVPKRSSNLATVEFPENHTVEESVQTPVVELKWKIGPLEMPFTYKENFAGSDPSMLHSAAPTE